MTMTTDWNWFFTSLAQSTAAIVGIFAAFIVTKILTNQSTFAERNIQILDLIATGQKIADASKRLPFGSYHRYNIDIELNKLLEEDDNQSPEALYDHLNFSPYIAKSHALRLINTKINEIKQKRQLEKQTKEKEFLHKYSVDADVPSELSFLKRNLNISQPSDEELKNKREKIDNLYDEAKHHARLVSNFHAIVVQNPESSKVITISLILILVLFFVGVIYPLSFMPLPMNWNPVTLSLEEITSFIYSLRGVLLSTVSLLFTTMLIIFFWMNIRSKYRVAILKRLEKYKYLSEYSFHFANREANAAQTEL